MQHKCEANQAEDAHEDLACAIPVHLLLCDVVPSEAVAIDIARVVDNLKEPLMIGKPSHVFQPHKM